MNIDELLDEQLQAGIKGDFKKGKEISEILKEANDPRVDFNRGWYAMMDGDLYTGMQLLAKGRWINVFGSGKIKSNCPIWNGEELNGKTVIFACEGGYGDEIINIRFVQDIIKNNGKVIVTCIEQLASVFNRIPGVSACLDRSVVDKVYHHYWLPAMSASLPCKHTFETIPNKPYITTLPEYVEKWNYLKGKIGLKFFGNPKFEHEQHRVFPRSLLEKATEKYDTVSLQLEDKVLDIQNWEDTLGIIQNLDLIITSCSSIAHAAGALGKDTWVIVPILPYYIWALPGNTSPWYKTVKLFRQIKYGDWNKPISDIQKELNKRYG